MITKSELIEIAYCPSNTDLEKELARTLLSGMEQEPVAWVRYCSDGTIDGPLLNYQIDDCRKPTWTPLYSAPKAAPVVPHNSVIAEQLANVLSRMEPTEHQRAVIGYAVDRLNENFETICQLSKAACSLPGVIDYQGAKELFNYLMNEEETNATVNGWNACRAAMLHGEPGSQPYKLQDGWIKCSERNPTVGQEVLVYRPDAPDSNDPLIKMAVYTRKSHHGFNCYCTPTHWMPLPAAPQQD